MKFTTLGFDFYDFYFTQNTFQIHTGVTLSIDTFYFNI